MRNPCMRPRSREPSLEPVFASAFRRGDHQAFARAVSLFDGRLRAYARSYALDQDEFDEIVQGTWVLAWEKRQQWRANGPLIAWLRKLARTTALRDARRKHRLAPLSAARSVAARPSANALLADSVQRDAQVVDIVGDLLAELPPRQRKALELRYYGRMSVHEVAGRMNVAEGTVKASIHNGIRGIRSHASASQLTVLRRHLDALLD